MSYYDIYSKYRNCDIDKIGGGAGEVVSLLSQTDTSRREEMARLAHELTLKHFGRVIQLYTPLYLSNYCDNECVYCGFNSNNDIPRKRLDIEEVKIEAQAIASTGLKTVLILTGESRKMSPVSYVKDCVKVLKKYFSSILIEIYPLAEEEYKELIVEGVDGLTIYQETYDEEVYSRIHPVGPKNDYRFRLDAPERGCKAGMRTVNIGALLGLSDWRRDAFFLALHAMYLQDKFPDVEIGVSVPRLRPHVGAFDAGHKVTDENVVRMILAFRITLPRLGITISTRENPGFRENLIGLGITRMSAGSTTEVGGRTITAPAGKGSCQFDISDRRSVEEIKAMLEGKLYQPVFKDWVRI